MLSLTMLATIVFLEFYFIEAGLFEYFPNIGIGFHFFGGFFVSVIVYYMFITALTKLDWYLIALFLIGTVCMAAVGWEGFEWVLSRITGSPYQVDVDNTMGDLFVGLAGGIVSCPFLLFRNSAIVRSIKDIAVKSTGSSRLIKGVHA